MGAPDQQPYHGYVYHEYPKWKYHADGTRSRIVDTSTVEEALGPWWFDSPAEADDAASSALQNVEAPAQPDKAPRARPKKPTEKNEEPR